MQSRPIAKIFFRGCSSFTLPVHLGTMLSDELLEQTREAAKAVNGRLEVMVNDPFSREVYNRLPANIKPKVAPPACDNGVNVTVYDPAALPRRIRVEPDVQESMRIE